MDLKHLNANSNYSKGFEEFECKFQQFKKWFEAIECKFESFEKDLKDSNPNSKRIRSIQMQIWTIWIISKRSIANSNHLKGIRSIQIQIWTIRKGFEVFERKFKHFEKDSQHWNPNLNPSNKIRSIPMQIVSIRREFEEFDCKFEPFENNSNHSKRIRSIRMQIRTIWKRFGAFQCKNQVTWKPSETYEYKFQLFEKGFEEFKCKF